MLVAGLSLTACSSSDLEPVYGIDPNTIVVGTFTQYDNAKLISPSGTIRFDSVLPFYSNRSFSLKATLDETLSTSSVKAIFYSSDQTLQQANDGISVTFARSGVNVTANISFNGSSAAVNSSKLTFYYPASLDVIIEVHNINNQARVFIWRRDLSILTAQTADVDTDRSADLASSVSKAAGTGGFVGLTLLNATVSAAKVGLAQVPN